MATSISDSFGQISCILERNVNFHHLNSYAEYTKNIRQKEIVPLSFLSRAKCIMGDEVSVMFCLKFSGANG